MKPQILLLMAVSGTLAYAPVDAQQLTLASAPPVVVKTVPQAGESDVDPNLSEIKVTFSKPMMDLNWSWVKWSEETFPEIGVPHYLADNRTCAVSVKLQPGRLYAIWINNEEFRNFKDMSGKPAVPYLLSFVTGTQKSSRPASPSAASRSGADSSASAGSPSAIFLPSLNPDQVAVLEWTDRQFRSFFDGRTFVGWDPKELARLETRLVDALKGPHNQDYFLAINTLGAMRSTNALPALRAIAYERADRNNRDRWMAIRSLGLIQCREDVPELIHMVYHGNPNTHWWAQIALVRITGQNLGSDWNAWGEWWNKQGGKPPYNPEIVKWWAGQPEMDELVSFLAESDKKFLNSVKPQGPSK